LHSEDEIVKAWEDISGPHFEGEEDKAVWEKFNSRFEFHPGVYSMPAIRDPTPSITYFIGHIYGSADRYSELVADLNVRMLAAFRRCVPPDGWLYALDWHHPSYHFRPHVLFDAADEKEWRVPVLPNGDYYIFLAEDLRFGVIGHPWEKTMCVYGTELLTALEADQPLLFDTIVRENGKQVCPLICGVFSLEDGDEVEKIIVGPRDTPLNVFLQQIEGIRHETHRGFARFRYAAVTEDIAP